MLSKILLKYKPALMMIGGFTWKLDGQFEFEYK
jgi:hypothetical protein